MTKYKDINSILNACQILRSFSPLHYELSPAEIARKSGLNKMTVHRVLSTLTKIGFLNRSETSGKYSIGPAIFTIGSLYLNTSDINKIAQPVTKLLNDLTGESINVAILDKANITFIMKEETKGPFRYARYVGTSLPAYTSSLGKSLLSDLTETEIDSLFPDERLEPLTKKTITKKTELKKELDEIRKTGVAYSIEGDWEGVVGIGSPIKDFSGKAVAAVSIAIPTSKFNEVTRERLSVLIKKTASLISYRLGYHDFEKPVPDIKEIQLWWEKHSLDDQGGASTN